MTTTKLQAELQKNVNSLIKNDKFFMQTLNELLKKHCPKDMLDELINAPEKDKEAITVYMLMAVAGKMTIDELFN